MIRFEMSTNVCNLITPDTYGTEFCAEIREERWEDFKLLMAEFGKTYLIGAIREVFPDAEVSNVTFHSPRFYNYTTDWLEFDLELEENDIESIPKEVNDDFFKFAKKSFGSHPGFVSMCPTEKEKFFEAMEGKGGYYARERAISMYIVWKFSLNNDLDDYNRDYLDEVWEYVTYHTDYREEDE